MITEELKKAKLTEAEYRVYQNLMDFPTLGLYLSSCAIPEDAVKILKAELEGRNRYSFIMRIYGRYRRLLPARDLKLLQKWGEKNGKSSK